MKQTDRLNKHLKLKGNTWYFQLRVPTCLQGHPMFVGKDIYTESLKTSDVGIARHRRDSRLDEIHALREGSRHAEFVAKTKEFMQANLEYKASNPTYLTEEGEEAYDDVYSHLLDHYADIARKEYQLTLHSKDLPEHLKLQADAVAYAHRLDLDPTTPIPLEYTKTFKEMLEQTITTKRRQGNREKTLQKMRTSASIFLDFLNVKDLPIAQVTRKQAAEFCHAIQESKSGSTVSGYMSFLGEIWRTARDLELVTGDNPFREHRIKDDGESYLPWSEHQIPELYAHLGQSASGRGPHRLYSEEDQLLFRMGLYTGARLEELHSLTKESLVERLGANGQKFLSFNIKPAGDGKTLASTRYVPVHPSLLEDMKTFNGFSGTADAAGKRFGRVKAHYLGLNNSKRLVFHSLRHFVSTELYRTGFDQYFIKFITGHSRGSGKSELERTYIHGPTYQQLVDAIYSMKHIV